MLEGEDGEVKNIPPPLTLLNDDYSFLKLRRNRKVRKKVSPMTIILYEQGYSSGNMCASPDCSNFLAVLLKRPPRSSQWYSQYKVSTLTVKMVLGLDS